MKSKKNRNDDLDASCNIAIVNYLINTLFCQHTLNGGILTQTFDNISSGIIPKRVVFALVESDAAIGNYTKNPFSFKHLLLTWLRSH